MIDQHIGVQEYRKRREALLRSLKGAVGVVFAGEGAPPLVGRWSPHQHFYYLTGMKAEHGAAVLFDPKSPDPTNRCVLLLKPRDPEAEAWDGYRESISAELRAKTGFDRIRRTDLLPRLLLGAARRSKRLACLHPFATHKAPVSPDLAVFREVSQRVVGVSIEDQTDLIPSMRAVKSRAEQGLIKKAIEATAAGLDAMLARLEPGVNEAALQTVLESTFREMGGTGAAYNPIVGAGLNSTVLHYNDNDREAKDGDLLVVDAGAGVGGYASDITRTYPVSGKFTKRQREVYSIVLKAQEAAIRAIKPGVEMHEVDGAARAVIEKAGFGDAYIHGIGHHLGLEVHDATPLGPLAPGHIVTIEPGIYLPDEKLGVRIEDDILVTPKGPRNLSAMIPKSVEEVEAQMKRARGGNERGR